MLALGALSLPPLEVVQRADRVLYDWWTRTAAPTAPDEIIVVNLDNPGWYTDLARIAREQGARLSMSSLAAPSAGDADAVELGPVAIAAAGSQLLRETGERAREFRTKWRGGAHDLAGRRAGSGPATPIAQPTGEIPNALL